MAERGNVGVGLSATALVAGLLTGTLLRPQPAPPVPKPPAEAPAPAHQEGEVAASPLKQLRPVMQLLGQSLGIDVDPTSQINAASAALGDVDNKELSIAVPTASLTKVPEPQHGPCGQRSDAVSAEKWDRGGMLRTLARVGARAGDLHADAVPKGYVSKALIADLEECADHQALESLVTTAGGAGFDVEFLVATVPDYVDSSSGWRADQVIDGIQSAMSDSGFVLDRFKLIDWARTERQGSEVMSSSRLHETQPGVLIFRRRTDAGVSLRVVLLVLETPTSGVHRESFRNAIEFLATWNAATTATSSARQKRHPGLRIIGPGFSGSVQSMALELQRISTNTFAAQQLGAIRVVSTATADENQLVMNQFAPMVDYHTTSRPSSQAFLALRAALGRMNPDWNAGRHVAMLLESNTGFGRAASKQLCQTDDKTEAETLPECDPKNRKIADSYWVPQFVFQFPLHIAQLMADFQSTAPPTISLLPSSAVPLNFRETIPPADQIPALRPQLTSAIVESQMNGILDNLEHEGITAVGIVATDERDVLFIARLLKRQAPNVQLFFTFNNLLYLHSDYLPYMRGALVASTYPLYLPNQQLPSGQRRLFQSMTSEAIYNAIRVQFNEEPLDYCDPAQSGRRGCVPPVWVSIVGDDGFWPIAWESFGPGPMTRAVANVSGGVHLLPLPGPVRVIALLLLAIIGAHAGIVLFAWAKLTDAHALRRFQRSPFLRVLAPPITYRSASRRHALALQFGFAVLTAFTLWLSGVLQLHTALERGWPQALALISTVLCGVAVMTPAILVAQRSRRHLATDLLPAKPPVRYDTDDAHPESGSVELEAPSNKSSLIGIIALIGLLGATLVCFLIFLAAAFFPESAKSDAFLRLTLDRFASDSMVSPAPAILCVFAAIYAAIFAGLRRISLLGSGYTALAAESATFRLLAGAPVTGTSPSADAQQSSARVAHLPLVCLLDMPAQNLPWAYPVALVGLLLTILWAIAWPHAVDGQAFSAFLMCGSAFVLGSALLLLAQAIEIWRRLRPGLNALSHSRIEPALESVAKVVRWNLSLVSPHLSDLEPLASLADRLHGRLLVLAAAGNPVARSSRVSEQASNTTASQFDYASALRALLDNRSPGGLLRRRDLDGPAALTRPCQLAELHKELEQQEYAPLLQSKTWFYLWGMSDQLVRMLHRVHWSRCEPLLVSHASTDQERKADIARTKNLALWFSDCETLIALQCALVLRDILARVMSCLFTAMLCLTLLTAAHLFYLFQGRSSLLTVDLMAVACAAGVAVWLLVAMERDTVLSRLRHTTPGRVDFNWEFLKRVGLYGALPLVAVLGSLFPEIQEPLFGWLEPLRKLVNF